MKAPCKGCELRHKLCWNTCENYIGYKNDLNKKKQLKMEYDKKNIVPNSRFGKKKGIYGQ